ncbi:RagB/SusD family nutrient uptake outer membrane protein [Chitinophaga silvisoli]|uniref:RagB/SusD family nutrient uptake outer membrane protein n=1 Tax=Chitinophaga silvisoli TaxID=2291814 RepID=A0A3E1PAA4_9BACT|nr:RagB/SusD family nutrient uptake outer membrane protein [Chitinophaga silvisoli]RFM36958.1 RagB/SusD family nutrient uptake outer membrane protein [Chitinophaga silvisoli]
MKVCIAVLLTILIISCNKLIDVGDPGNSVIGKKVFSHDTSALSAVSGIYSKIMVSFPNILNAGISICAGLSADEIQPNNSGNSMTEFYTNTISTQSSFNRIYLWYYGYTLIYQTNACIEGIVNSNKLSEDVSNQLLGEVYFFRALIYFQMIQLYGNVPLVVSTNYEDNARLKRTETNVIFSQIKEDLLKASGLLSENYPSNGRVRVNRWASKALLAKIYLYGGDWIDAESASGQVINAGPYLLEKDFNRVFLYDSKEAILQLLPTDNGYNTSEAAQFVPNPSGTSLPQYSLTAYLLNTFEPGDKRFINWIGKKTVNGITYTFPYKYKVRPNFGPTFAVTEYNMVLRLAEQYLIRAEARAHLSNLTGAIADIDSIRKRAGLPLIAVTNPGITYNELLLAIQKERMVELFTEWGNRWFDLKRTQTAVSVLANRKAGWRDVDTLYPVPEAEIKLNPNLIQNPGYN